MGGGAVHDDDAGGPRPCGEGNGREIVASSAGHGDFLPTQRLEHLPPLYLSGSAGVSFSLARYSRVFFFLFSNATAYNMKKRVELLYFSRFINIANSLPWLSEVQSRFFVDG